MDMSIEMVLSIAIGVAALLLLAFMVQNYTGGAEEFFTGVIS